MVIFACRFLFINRRLRLSPLADRLRLTNTLRVEIYSIPTNFCCLGNFCYILSSILGIIIVNILMHILHFLLRNAKISNTVCFVILHISSRHEKMCEWNEAAKMHSINEIKNSFSSVAADRLINNK